MYRPFDVWIPWYIKIYYIGDCVQNEAKNAILCRCHQGWKGEKCSEIDCISGVSCSGHGIIWYKYLGTCTVLGNKRFCQCHDGWAGQDCNKKNCHMENKCKTKGFYYIKLGECYLNINNQEKCKCFEGWGGESCDKVECPENVCGANGIVTINIGKCDSEDGKLICRCYPGWSGDTCSEMSCENWKGCEIKG